MGNVEEPKKQPIYPGSIRANALMKMHSAASLDWALVVLKHRDWQVQNDKGFINKLGLTPEQRAMRSQLMQLAMKVIESIRDEDCDLATEQWLKYQELLNGGQVP